MSDTNLINPTRRVLVVDDMAIMRKTVEKHCRAIGYEDVVTCKNGQEAWDLLKSEPPDTFGLVLSDWMMPVMKGIELLQKVREDPELKDLPFIMVTAEGDKDSVVEIEAKGASGYVIKPFGADKLLGKIAEISGLLSSRGEAA